MFASYSGVRMVKLKWILSDFFFFYFALPSDTDSRLLMIATPHHLRCVSFSRKHQETVLQKRLNKIRPDLNSDQHPELNIFKL